MNKRMIVGITILSMVCTGMTAGVVLRSGYLELISATGHHYPFMNVMKLPLLVSCVSVLFTGVAVFAGLCGVWSHMDWKLSRANKHAKGLQSVTRRNHAEESPGDIDALLENLEAADSELQTYAKNLSHTLERMSCGDFTGRVDTTVPEGFKGVQTSLQIITKSMGRLFEQVSELSKWAMDASAAVRAVGGKMRMSSKSQGQAASSIRENVKQVRLVEQTAAENLVQTRLSTEAGQRLTTELQGQMEQFRERMKGAYGMLAELSTKIQTAGRLHRQNAAVAVSSAYYAPLENSTFARDMTIREMQSSAEKGESAAHEAGYLLADITELCEDIWDYTEQLEGMLEKLGEQQSTLFTALEQLRISSKAQGECVHQTEKQAAVLEVLSASAEECAVLCGKCGDELLGQATQLSHITRTFHTQGSSSATNSSPIIFEDTGEHFVVR